MTTLSKNILIVDDDLQFRLSLVKTFVKAGYRVSAVTDGQEALNLIRKSFYDLIITDQKIPGINGLELLSQIKELSPKTEVILITAYGDVSLHRRAKDAGAFGYLDKPLKREEILSLAANAIKRTTVRHNTEYTNHLGPPG